jgi:hypothetical protein
VNARALTLCLLGSLPTLRAQEEPKSSAEASWRVRGRAVDEHGKPIAGVSVAMQPGDAFLTAAVLASPVKTDADGRFELVVVGWDQDGPDWRTPVIAAAGRATVLAGSASSWIRPAGNGDVDLGDLVLPPGSALRGVVRTAGGRPLAGVRVSTRDPRLCVARHDWRPDECSYATATVSADDGSFELTGVTEGGAKVTFDADGHHRRELAFVLPGDPLVVELTPGGHVEGVVKDGSGRACPDADLIVHYAASVAPESHRAGQDGRFKLTLAYPHAYRVEAAGARWFHQATQVHGAIRAGPAQGLVLTRGSSAEPERTLLLRTTDAEDGRAVEEVRAAAIWAAPEFLEMARNPRLGILRGSSSLRGPGEVRLPGPSAGEPSSGIVIVTADGYAPLVLDGVEWSERDPLMLEAKLVRESVLTGAVVDASSGGAVAGALVMVVDDANSFAWSLHSSGASREPGHAVTDGAGRFRLGGLAAGTHKVRAFLLGRPPSEVIEVEVGAAASKDQLELSLPRGSRLTGKLTGIEPARGWEVRLRERQTGVGDFFMRLHEERTTPRAIVAPDGTFVITGIPDGTYDVRLSVPRSSRRGALDLGVGSVRIRGEDLERDFEAGRARPGTIRGTVTVAGAELPRQRLAITAFAPTERDVIPWGEDPYLVEPVRADGTFAFLAVPGRQRIEVVDLATLIPLAVVDGVRVTAGESTEVQVPVEIVPVHVRLKPEKDGGEVAVASLEVGVQHEGRLALLPFFVPELDQDTGIGVALAGRGDDVELLLPLVATKLRVRSHHARVFGAEWKAPPLGEAEVTPTKDGENRIEIEVRTPPQPDGK